MDTREESVKTIAELSGVNARTLQRGYKQHNPDYQQWDQRDHAKDWLVFPQHIGPLLAIDEVSLSQGELYTFVTNKAANGKKGALVACIRGTRSDDIVKVLQRISLQDRNKVSEVSVDMAKNMESAIRHSFPNAKLVTDRFHVMALAHTQLQLLRTQLWKTCLEQENQAIEQARKEGKPYQSIELANGDSPKQLLARSRYALFKAQDDWTGNQSIRMRILFEHYPSLHWGWKHVQDLAGIFELESRNRAELKLNEWINAALHPQLHTWNKAEQELLAEFATVAKSIRYHLDSILNFFTNRSTNANAESFNAKIKLFRAKLKGVRDKTFFLYRLTKLFT